MIDGWTVSMHFHSNYIYVIFLQPAGVLITSSKVHDVFVQENSRKRAGRFWWLAELWVRKNVSGVEKIHAMNVVHRDLKPAAKLQSAVDDVQQE